MTALVVAPQSREGAESKGRRLLCEGRLIVRQPITTASATGLLGLDGTPAESAAYATRGSIHPS